jgi:uncharacterized surface protein with fasciclin (FAS1) repeats
LVLAACGDDDDGATDATTEETAAAEETETSAADDAMVEQADIVDTAVSAGSFETLVTAVQAAGLEETLRGDGPFTVFAPTDDAFAALPAGTLDTLLGDPEGDLAGILTYHVVSGEVLAADVGGLAGQSLTTVNGATFTVNVGGDGSVTLTDGAGNEVTVVQTDIRTSNGVIHVLDGVLLPG